MGSWSGKTTQQVLLEAMDRKIARLKAAGKVTVHLERMRELIVQARTVQ